MEEKRELPEGVKEEMGACIFCGQTYMFANVGLGTEQLNEAATERCTCEEAKNWQVQRKRAEKVRKKTERIFANDKCLNFMLTTVKMNDGTVGTIALTKKGSIKIQRSKTIQDAAEG